MSRIKPGDLCLVRSAGPYGGRLVEALTPAPFLQFTLPDGHAHAGCKPNHWVIKSLGSPIRAQCDDGTLRDTMFGVAHESRLIPIRGDEAPEVVKRELELEA